MIKQINGTAYIVWEWTFIKIWMALAQLSAVKWHTLQSESCSNSIKKKHLEVHFHLTIVDRGLSVVPEIYGLSVVPEIYGLHKTLQILHPKFFLMRCQNNSSYEWFNMIVHWMTWKLSSTLHHIWFVTNPIIFINFNNSFILTTVSVPIYHQQWHILHFVWFRKAIAV